MLNFDIEVVFNQFEALLWLTISLAILIYTIVQRLRKIFVPWHGLILIPAFALFGFSDFIEAKTGAWWTPWWLLVIKAFCIAIFLFSFLNYLKRSKKSRKSDDFQ